MCVERDCEGVALAVSVDHLIKSSTSSHTAHHRQRSIRVFSTLFSALLYPALDHSAVLCPFFGGHAASSKLSADHKIATFDKESGTGT